MAAKGAAKVLEHPPRRKGAGAELAAEKIDRVLELLPLLYPETTLQRKVSAEFGVGLRQSRRYIAAARKELRDRNDLTRGERREQLRATFQMLLRKAVEMPEPDLPTAVRAGHELALLDGLNEPDQIVVTAGEGASVVASLERLEELRRKQAEAEGTGTAPKAEDPA